jgi:hypothetical protein
MTPNSAAAAAGALEEARLLLVNGDGDADILYRRWFHREIGAHTVWPDAAAYRAATIDPARFEAGWSVVASGHGQAGAVVVMRGGRERLVAPPAMTPDDPRDLAPARGSSVRVDPLASGEAGGFWHMWSAGWQAQVPQRFQRIYCCVEPRRALDAAARVAAGAPPRATWAMKALCGAHDAGRRDRVLLYLPFDTPLDSGWVARLLEEMRPACGQELPPFVEPMGTGLGWAPDPGGGRSFGQALSEAVVSAVGHAADPPRFTSVALAAIRALPDMDRSALVRTGDERS